MTAVTPPTVAAGAHLAVIGAGIAGLSTAWLLDRQYRVTLFEAEPRAGGHAETQEVPLGNRTVAVDTGFIVYNERNYPHLTGLFAHLGVSTHASEMSFAVSARGGRFEYGGGTVTQLIAQKRNLLRPRFWSMVSDVARFYRNSPRLLDGTSEESLGAFLDRERYGDTFVHDHILPMGAAIWSTSVAGMRAFPARHFIRFFQNHGLLSLTDRPQWRTVTGGSREYVARLMAGLRAGVHLGRAVRAVAPTGTGARLVLADGSEAAFDGVVFACHADQARALLAQPTETQDRILAAIRCEDNTAVLHTDARLMPRRRAIWSAWNYISDGARDRAQKVSVTYWMNRLQGLRTAEPFLVSLNPLRAPDPMRVISTRTYRHPQFDAAAIAAQAQLPMIQGKHRMWFAGAWTGWGFHEDGIASAVRVARAFGVTPPWDMPGISTPHRVAEAA